MLATAVTFAFSANKLTNFFVQFSNFDFVGGSSVNSFVFQSKKITFQKSVTVPPVNCICVHPSFGNIRSNLVTYFFLVNLMSSFDRQCNIFISFQPQQQPLTASTTTETKRERIRREEKNSELLLHLFQRASRILFYLITLRIAIVKFYSRQRQSFTTLQFNFNSHTQVIAFTTLPGATTLNDCFGQQQQLLVARPPVPMVS